MPFHELLYMKNLSVFILARKILFCSIIFPHSHKRTCPTHPTTPVRFVYGYRREGEGSRGSWKLYMLKKGSGIFVAEEKGEFFNEFLKINDDLNFHI